MKSAAAGIPTDGATGQPVRAVTAVGSYRTPRAEATDALALARFRDAEGLDLEPVDVPPDAEGISALEDRAHTASWHQYLASDGPTLGDVLTERMARREHDTDSCPCNNDPFGNGPCRACRDVFAHRRSA